MKVILLKNIDGLGREGEVKNVADGYARNYLIKNNLAKAVTEASLKEINELKKKKKLENEENLKKLNKLSDELSNKIITIKAKQKDGKLFGSITRKMIADELIKNSFDVDENSIVLEESIKTVGEVKIEVNLGRGIKSNFVLKILSE